MQTRQQTRKSGQVKRPLLHILTATLLLSAIVFISSCDDVDSPVGGSDLLVSPSNLDFGQVKIAESRTLTVRVSNNGGENITIAAQLRGTDAQSFSIVSQPSGVLAPGISADVQIKFSPTSERAYSASLRVGIETTVDIGLSGSGVTTETPQGPTLASAHVAKGPTIDGSGNDAVWQSAVPLTLTLRQVVSSQASGSHAMTLKSVNDGQNVYFLVEVSDPQSDLLPASWALNGNDASQESNWMRRTSFGQDGFSFMFPVSSNVRGDASSETFETVGCNAACHTTEALENYEGGMYPTQGTVDIWYWKAATTNPQGYADDYVAAGSDGGAMRNERRADDGRSFAQENFSSAGLGFPLRLAGGGNGGLNTTNFIWNDSSVPFNFNSNPATGSAWKNGDFVPGWLLRTDASTSVSRMDIRAKGVYDAAQNRWVIEFSRKLSTGHSDDVNLGGAASVPFSVAYFNNSRKYANFEYSNLGAAPRPSHFGTDERTLWLTLE